MDADRPVAFLLHGLGGSAGVWRGVQSFVASELDAIAIDLPGFGAARELPGVSVSEMADHVIAIIRATGAARWLLVGHSMGGKIASAVASRTLAGEEGLFGLAGVVLLAGSPPSPEPMDEDRRQEMIGWVANGPLNVAAARNFIDANVAAPLDAEADELALNDLERSSPLAWRAWLERGSREDWSAEVGTLEVPALNVVGSEDKALGEDGQRATNALVYPGSQLLSVDGAAHLLMLEKPREVAEAILRFWHGTAGIGPGVSTAFGAMIASARVSQRTRGILASRALADVTGYMPQVLTPSELATLRAIAELVVPQGDGIAHIDLAARIDKQLSRNKGDGWRFATLPPDGQAYARALDTLDGFALLPDTGKAHVLEQLAAGVYVPADASRQALLDAAQMKQWFEDARTDLVRTWLAHPATMERIGFDGFANGGDAARKQGFTLTGADEREPWEQALLDRAVR